MQATIYKICETSEWDAAQAAGVYSGSPDDMRDGFIHFSTAEQVRGTAEKHFRNRASLVLVDVDAALLGDALKWEASRGGQLFPHLYGALPIAAATRARNLPINADGVPVVPDLAADN